MPRFFESIGRMFGKGKRGKTEPSRNTVTGSTVESLPSMVAVMPEHGWVSILIEPESARDAVRWRVSGQTVWHTHGQHVQVETGNHVIEFSVLDV